MCRGRGGDLLSGGGREAAEPVHRDDLHGLAPRLGRWISQALNAALERPGIMSSSLAGPVPARTITRALRATVRRHRLLIDVACPGLVATDFTGFQGRPPHEGAATAIRLATLPDGRPTGSFFNDDGAIPW